MFSNLKKKLSGAVQDGLTISEGLQQHYRQRGNCNTTKSTLLANTTDNNKHVSDVLPTRDSDMTVDYKLLVGYEKDFIAIHAANEENGAKAQAIAAQVDTIQQRTVAQEVVMKDLVVCLSNIPTLMEILKNSAQTLQHINALSEATEKQLVRLQMLCGECELQEFALQKQYELSQYKRKKMMELELYRQKIATEHQQKIVQYEERLCKIQAERQAVFDDAFRGDLEDYKQRGTIPKIVKGSGSHEVPLEEIDLEDTTTKDALEEFLNA